ncbi:class I glutamine amidotransferase-like protein [Cladorrhinum samala]|uniref:D-lactate dehydratase n=1 Tax=Cladorrhinum samala TaxID=585594 RepID=A0AAV9HE66_9PEZI|nr:class I glutamine amidotransferase-like protein [Cladorrhinum samala]
MSSPKILVVLTSHDKLGDTGKPTGWYLSEFSHPHHVFDQASATLTVASPKGGAAPLDPSSVEAAKEDDVSVKFLNSQSQIWSNTSKVSEFLGKADEFDAIFYPGGHGPMYDLAVDEDSQKLIAEFWAKGKVVAAVCHGPAAFVNVKLADGKPLVDGKKLTAFSDAEEQQVGADKAVPFALETKLKEEGAKYEKAAEAWGEKVVVDGRLVTGQNPASAKGVGEAILKALKA